MMIQTSYRKQIEQKLKLHILNASIERDTENQSKLRKHSKQPQIGSLKRDFGELTSSFRPPPQRDTRLRPRTRDWHRWWVGRARARRSPPVRTRRPTRTFPPGGTTRNPSPRRPPRLRSCLPARCLTPSRARLSPSSGDASERESLARRSYRRFRRLIAQLRKRGQRSRSGGQRDATISDPNPSGQLKPVGKGDDCGTSDSGSGTIRRQKRACDLVGGGTEELQIEACAGTCRDPEKSKKQTCGHTARWNCLAKKTRHSDPLQKWLSRGPHWFI